MTKDPIPEYFAKFGRECQEEHSALSNAEKHKLASIYCAAYQKTQKEVFRRKVFSLVFLYISALPFKRRNFLQGFTFEEMMSHAYVLLGKTMMRYRPETNVPFMFYFAKDLRGNLGEYRKSLRKSWEVYSPSSDWVEFPSQEEGSEEDLLLHFMNQLEEMEDSEDKALAIAYMKAWASGRTPRAGTLAQLSGLSVSQVSQACAGVPKLVQSLIF